MEDEIRVIKEEFDTVDSLKKILNLIKKRGIIVEEIDYLYYPYWLVKLSIHVKQLFGSREFKKVFLMIDGLSGVIGYSEEPILRIEKIGKNDGKKYLKPKMRVKDVDIRKYIIATFPLKYRISLAKDIIIKSIQTNLVYKKFWLIKMHNPKTGKKITLLIDSVSGAMEYVF